MRFHSTVGEGSSVERCSAMFTGQHLTDISVDWMVEYVV